MKLENIEKAKELIRRREVRLKSLNELKEVRLHSFDIDLIPGFGRSFSLDGILSPEHKANLFENLIKSYIDEVVALDNEIKEL